MKKSGIPQTGESAASQARFHAAPSDRILVVDDDVDIRQVNAEVLRRFDNNMPKVSGVELVVRSARMTLPVIWKRSATFSRLLVKRSRC